MSLNSRRRMMPRPERRNVFPFEHVPVFLGVFTFNVVIHSPYSAVTSRPFRVGSTWTLSTNVWLLSRCGMIAENENRPKAMPLGYTTTGVLPEAVMQVNCHQLLVVDAAPSSFFLFPPSDIVLINDLALVDSHLSGLSSPCSLQSSIKLIQPPATSRSSLDL